MLCIILLNSIFLKTIVKHIKSTLKLGILFFLKLLLLFILTFEIHKYYSMIHKKYTIFDTEN